MTENVKKFWLSYEWPIVTVILTLALVVISFDLGRISANASTPITVTYPLTVGNRPERPMTKEDLPYLASVNGSRYYPSNCPAAARISNHNRIWFDTKTQAENAGYTVSSQCPATHH